MKKKYLYTVLALSGLLLNTACSLDETPENALTYANSFNTETELNATATSINYYINTAIKDDPVFDTAGSLADELSDNESVREWNPVSVVNAQQAFSMAVTSDSFAVLLATFSAASAIRRSNSSQAPFMPSTV